MDGLLRDRFGGGVIRPGPRDLGQDVLLERHDAAHRRYERRQLVMALLEHDVDIRPRLVDPLAERHDRVVADDRHEQHDREHEPTANAAATLAASSAARITSRALPNDHGQRHG